MDKSDRFSLFFRSNTELVVKAKSVMCFLSKYKINEQEKEKKSENENLSTEYMYLYHSSLSRMYTEVIQFVCFQFDQRWTRLSMDLLTHSQG